MASLQFLHLVLFFLFAALASSSPISYNSLESHGFTGRNLLQAKTACPVNFENENYTIITSQCKGPHYLPKPCCDSFKQIACPYAEELNDEKNDCAATLFSYINLYGKYPPGLFASLCREGKDGLSCDDFPNSPAQNSTTNPTKSGARSLKSSLSLILVLMTGFLVLPFNSL